MPGHYRQELSAREPLRDPRHAWESTAGTSLRSLARCPKNTELPPRPTPNSASCPGTPAKLPQNISEHSKAHPPAASTQVLKKTPSPEPLGRLSDPKAKEAWRPQLSAPGACGNPLKSPPGQQPASKHPEEVGRAPPCFTQAYTHASIGENPGYDFTQLLQAAEPGCTEGSEHTAAALHTLPQRVVTGTMHDTSYITDWTCGFTCLTLPSTYSFAAPPRNAKGTCSAARTGPRGSRSACLVCAINSAEQKLASPSSSLQPSSCPGKRSGWSPAARGARQARQEVNHMAEHCAGTA